MSLLKRIFGNPDDASKIVDGAINTLDNAFFTKQERSIASEKVSEFYLKYLAATQGQNLARRFIAVLVVSLWVLLIVCGVIVRAVSLEFSEFIFRVLVDVVMQPFSIVIGFYFLTHTVRAFQKEK